jgi:hypothetical protein
VRSSSAEYLTSNIPSGSNILNLILYRTGNIETQASMLHNQGSLDTYPCLLLLVCRVSFVKFRLHPEYLKGVRVSIGYVVTWIMSQGILIHRRGAHHPQADCYNTDKFTYVPFPVLLLCSRRAHRSVKIRHPTFGQCGCRPSRTTCAEINAPPPHTFRLQETGWLRQRGPHAHTT